MENLFVARKCLLRLSLRLKKEDNKEVRSVQKSKQECISFLSFSLTERFLKLVHNSSDTPPLGTSLEGPT